MARAGISNESVDETDRQIVFVDQTMQAVEQQRLRREAERQAEVNRQLALKKKQTEAQLAKQFAGLSGRLSGLPQIPSFEGEFQEEQTTDKRLPTIDKSSISPESQQEH